MDVVRRSTVLRIVMGFGLLLPAAALGQAAGVRADAPGVVQVAPGAVPIDQRVIVILADQHQGLRGAVSQQIREDVVRHEQAPLLDELSRAKAPRVIAFHLINAVAATVPSAEVDRLRTAPGVAAVVPDLSISLPRPTGPTETAYGHTGAQTVHANTAYTCPSTPTIEPEGLALTHTLGVPSAINGSGVKVAFIADGLDINNPEFIRSNNSHVIVDYKDFSGDGTAAASSGGSEAFGDAGTIAAQARQTYDAGSYVVPAHTGCPIKIRGVAPGASLLALKDTAKTGGISTAAVVEAIQYAVDQHVDVINESLEIFGFPPPGDAPVRLADDAAIAAGVTVVAASGDAGVNNATSYMPANDPSVITAGATTQLRTEAEMGGDGFALSNGQWISNNIAALSSGGFTPTGVRSVDLVAPGFLSWVPCTANTTLYPDCTNDGGNASSFNQFWGTSEAAPFVSGEAALVIQAYRKTHNNKSPSPALVKQLITGTADDLGIPSNLQGAGLMDSQRAVQAAMSVQDANGTPTPAGAALLSSPSWLSATDLPGKTQTFSMTVTNNGAIARTVKPSVRTLSAPQTLTANVLTLDPSTALTFPTEAGDQVPYVTQTFTVPSGVRALKAAISWDVIGQPGTWVRLVLLDPQKRFVQFSNPQGSSGYGQDDVRNPAVGTWTAVLWTRTYKGSVHLTVTSSHFVSSSLAQPPASISLAPGASGMVTVKINTPGTAGDVSDDLVLAGAASGHPTVTSVVPLYLRSLIPLGPSGGTFGGTLTGGNGRGSTSPTLTYAFDVPSGLKDLDLSIHLNDSNYHLTGFLIDPSGVPLEAQTTETDFAPKFTNTMQFFRRDPAAGRWSFLLAIDDTISGAQTSLPFTGTIKFNGVSVQAPKLPNSAGTTLTAGQPVTVPITVTNTGNTTKDFFADARLNTTIRYSLFSSDSTVPPYAGSLIDPPVPPETTDFTVNATSPDGPLTLVTFSAIGSPPDANAFSPSLQSSSQLVQGVNTATNDYTAPEVASGFWQNDVNVAGTFGSSGSPTTHVHVQPYITTLDWDPAVVADSGDYWAIRYPGSAKSFTPLTLAPGAQGTINLTITPSGTPGTVVQGHIFIDTLHMSGSGEVAYFSGDQLIELPYQYTIG